MPLPVLAVAGGYIAATVAAGAMVRYVHNKELVIALPHPLPILRDLQFDLQVNSDGILFTAHRRGHSAGDSDV